MYHFITYSPLPPCPNALYFSPPGQHQQRLKMCEEICTSGMHRMVPATPSLFLLYCTEAMLQTSLLHKFVFCFLLLFSASHSVALWIAVKSGVARIKRTAMHIYKQFVFGTLSCIVARRTSWSGRVLCCVRKMIAVGGVLYRTHCHQIMLTFGRHANRHLLFCAVRGHGRRMLLLQYAADILSRRAIQWRNGLLCSQVNYLS